MNEPSADGSEGITLARVQPLLRKEQSASTATHHPPFKVISRDELDNQPDPEWLVYDFIQTESSNIIFGAPGIGKSFIALDLALSVATGRDWHKRAVRRGPVVYITPEGLKGLKVRVRAWEIMHGGLRGEDFFVIPDAPQLLNGNDVSRLIQSIHTIGRNPVVIVIDTLARHFVGGDENNAKDMGIFVAAVDRIRKEFKCTAILLHHTTKAGDDMRGSGSLHGALDTAIIVKRAADGTIEVSCAKQKDWDEFDKMRFNLSPVQVPPGDAMSCVLVEAGPFQISNLKHQYVGNPAKAAKGDEHRQSILRAFKTLGAMSIPLTRSQIENEAKVPDGSWRAAKALEAQGLLKKAGHGLYQLTDQGRSAVDDLP